MKRRPEPSRRISPAVRFREQIENAELDGRARDDMVLQLTLGDANLLKRDRTLPLSDISFGGGVMRYLGVRIVEGGVAESELVSATPGEPGEGS